MGEDYRDPYHELAQWVCKRFHRPLLIENPLMMEEVRDQCQELVQLTSMRVYWIYSEGQPFEDGWGLQRPIPGTGPVDMRKNFIDLHWWPASFFGDGWGLQRPKPGTGLQEVREGFIHLYRLVIPRAGPLEMRRITETYELEAGQMEEREGFTDLCWGSVLWRLVEL